MLGKQSFKCLVKVPFRYQGIEYDINDTFTVRTFSPLERGYLNIGFVEKFNKEDYSYYAIEEIKVDNTKYSNGKEIPLEIVNKIDIDMYVRLGYVDQILKADLEKMDATEVVTSTSDIKLLPKGIMPCKAHKYIDLDFTSFMDLLKSLGYEKVCISKALPDEITEEINKALSSK